MPNKEICRNSEGARVKPRRKRQPSVVELDFLTIEALSGYGKEELPAMRLKNPKTGMQMVMELTPTRLYRLRQWAREAERHG